MDKSSPPAGYFSCGVPYNRYGRGPRPLVAFMGLMFENKPLPAFSAPSFGGYGFLGEDYTIYLVNRKPNLPAGYSMKNMADDYAVMIRDEFDGPVDVIGVSTGGSIAQHLGADHPDLIRKLVIHSSAWKLSDRARAFQLLLGRLGSQGRWREAIAESMRYMLIRSEKPNPLVTAGIGIASSLGALLISPEDASDLVVTVEAEDRHDFKDRLAEICVPTLVAAGELDPFYTPDLFRETAAGIPNAEFRLYEGVGHPASGKPFERDLLAFLQPDAG